jgi:hypothetical protein
MGAHFGGAGRAAAGAGSGLTPTESVAVHWRFGDDCSIAVGTLGTEMFVDVTFFQFNHQIV